MSKITSIKTLGKIAKYSSVVTLLDLLDDEDVEVRIAVIETLGELASKFPGDILLPLFARVYDESEDPAVRAKAVETLGTLGSIVDIRWLTDALYDADWRVREQAAIALGKQGDRTPTEVLEAVLDDESEQVCKAAVHALGKLWEYKSARLSMISQQEGSDTELVVKETKEDYGKGGTGGTGSTISEPGTQRFTSGNVEFEGLDASFFADSDVIPIVAQALDNQWVPRTLLDSMFKGKITYIEAEKYLEGLVRTEYIRALINGERLIINRAFLYNNSVLFRDYLPGQASRATFEYFLDQGIIIPFLLYEHAPNEAPAFNTNKQGFSAWQEVCQEVFMKCIRFSWDDEVQKEAQRSFTNRYHDFVQAINAKDLKRYARDLGFSLEEQQAFRKRLSEVHKLGEEYFEEHWEEDIPFIRRNDLYKSFVTAGDNPALRMYDGSKPFAREIKELLDLAYNGYLADELNGYLLTPINSPNRLALQEWEAMMKHKTSVKPDLFQVLRSSVFTLQQGGLYLKSMGSLTLQDVQRVRQTEQWSRYIQSLRHLLQNPIQFSELADEVYRNYVQLMYEATALIEQRNTQRGGILTAEWKPSTEVRITVGGAALTVLWNEEGNFFVPEGEVGMGAARGSAPFTMKLTIGDSNRSRAQADLFSSIDIMQGKMTDARKQWQDILKQFRDDLHFKEFTRGPIKELVTPTINEQEDV